MVSRDSRRQFLLSFLGFGLLALARPRSIWTAAAKQTEHDPLTSALDELLRHKGSAVIVGHEYLQATPGERDPQILLHLISPRCGKRLFGSDCKELRSRLRLQMRKDFEEGHIIKIHGWLLSLTEARLCALAALLFHSSKQSLSMG